MENIEIWKPVKGYEGFYEVSNLGRVKSLDRISARRSREVKLKGKVLAKRISNHGYITVILYKDNKSQATTTHRLVAMAFIDNPHNYNEVNHINLIKDDNRVENLEWCNRSQNMLHAGLNGRLSGTKGMFLGSKSVRSKVKEEDVLEMRRLKKEGLNSTQIQKVFPSLGARHIRDILNRVYWNHI
jgi:hypothetical protein